MFFKRITLLFLFGLMIVSLISCGTGGTQVVGTWKNDQVEFGTIKKVLIVGIIKDPWIRKMYESAVKEELLNHHVEAVSSLEIVSPDEKITKENFELYFQSYNFDSVIASRVVAEDKVKTRVYNYTPVYGYHGFYNSYYSMYSYAYNPGYAVESTNRSIETNLFETKGGNMIWSTLSESFDAQKASDIIGPLSQLILDELDDSGFIE
ncbi:MAG: hypothetical protein KAQ90_10210 [Melioribacteraceae bacterium]|nr:hypothetical protein [Melioribacteraceae bacterium]